MQKYVEKQVNINNFANEQSCSRKALSSLKSQMLNIRSNMCKLLKSKSEQNIEIGIVNKVKFEISNKEMNKIEDCQNKFLNSQEIHQKLKSLEKENDMLKQKIKEIEKEKVNQKESYEKNQKILENENVLLLSKLMTTLEQLQKVKGTIKNSKKSSKHKISKQTSSYFTQADFEKLNPEVIIGEESKQSVNFHSLIRNLNKDNSNLLNKMQKIEVENNSLHFEVKMKDELIKKLNEIVMKKQIQLLQNRVKNSMLLSNFD